MELTVLSESEKYIRKRLPYWLKNKSVFLPSSHKVKTILRKYNLHSVCEEAKCPNRGECFSKGTATFLIMGDVCTRNCTFCAVKKGLPKPIDKNEPEKLKNAVSELNLKYVVLTSVTRDDLEDGGGSHFEKCVKAIKSLNRKILVEVLVPDFSGKISSIRKVIKSGVDVFNHNIETVPSLYKKVRPLANYETSLKVLESAKEINPDIPVKSGIMVGLGETMDEIMSTLRDIKTTGCDLLTVGQYLQPRYSNLVVDRYVTLEEFDEIKKYALSIGFKDVFSGPLVRSSYFAHEMFEKLKNGK